MTIDYDHDNFNYIEKISNIEKIVIVIVTSHRPICKLNLFIYLHKNKNSFLIFHDALGAVADFQNIHA